MAISNTNKPLSLPVLAFFITLFLVLLTAVNSSSSLSFSFDSFEKGEKDIILQGDATISSKDIIELTLKDSQGAPEKLSVGRALYSTQLHLWDSASGNVASFETTFTFVLTSTITNYPAHGLAFFIAPPETTIPYNSTRGFLGLFTPAKALNASANQIVAVEFDTYADKEWDPSSRHIGIDVNTINSTSHVSWDRREGVTATARITYNSANGRLSVASYYADSDQDYVVSHIVDLKTILPEWVRIGFSASTGNYIQTHDILSWSFNSYLDTTRAKKEEKYIARYV